MRFLFKLVNVLSVKSQAFFWTQVYNLYFLLHPSVKKSASVKVTGRIKMIVDPYSEWRVGSLRINSGNLINSFGGHRRMVIRVLKGGKLRIGNNVGISSSTIICTKEIEIQDNVLIGGNTHIFDTDFHSIDFEGRMKSPDTGIKRASVIIQEGAFIGGGSYILKGVTIGKKSVVAAGSVVTKSIPDMEIWGGNPAKFIKSI